MKLLILDRDGVINQDSEDFIKRSDEWWPIAGSLEAIARATAAGFTIAVATNQSGVARGLFSVDELSDIHEVMIDAIEEAGGKLAMIAFCPHAPDDDCSCRKPKPGLLQSIARELDCELTGVPCIGDALRDLEAATAVGARPILVRTGKGALAANDFKGEIYDDLAAAIDALLKEGD